MAISLFHIAFLTASLGAAVNDFLFYRIPNAIMLFLLGLFLFKVSLFDSFSDFKVAALVFAISILGGFLLYTLKIMGAGDAKFIAIGAMWASESNLWMFFIVTSLVGGMMAIGYLMWGDWINVVRYQLRNIFENFLNKSNYKRFFNLSRLKQDGSEEFIQATKRKRVLPYGVAVFAGCVVSVLIR